MLYKWNILTLDIVKLIDIFSWLKYMKILVLLILLLTTYNNKNLKNHRLIVDLMIIWVLLYCQGKYFFLNILGYLILKARDLYQPFYF